MGMIGTSSGYGAWRWVVIGVAATVLLPVGSARAAEARARLAVPSLRAAGLDAELTRLLTEVLTTEVAQLERYEVIGASDIEAILGYEKERELVGCEDDLACVAEIAGALGADFLLVGDLGEIGETYVLNLKLVDTEAVAVRSRAYEVVEHRPELLIEATRKSLQKLFAGTAGANEEASVATAGRAVEPPAARASAVSPREVEPPTVATEEPVPPEAAPAVLATPPVEPEAPAPSVSVAEPTADAAATPTPAPLPATDPSAAVTTEREPRSHLLGWILLGVGVAVITFGIFFDTLADSSRDGRLEAVDFVPIGAYALGGGTVGWALWDLLLAD